MRKSEISGVLGLEFGRKAKWVAGIALLAAVAACKTTEPATVVDTTIVQPDMTPLERRAASYVQFRADVDLLNATVIDSPQATRDAHNRLASHAPDLLSSGWVAYAALLAADNPTFAQSVQAEMVKAGGRSGFLNSLRQNPSMVLNFEGSSAAIDDVLKVTAMDAYKVKALSDFYISEAYRLQKVSWAKKKISPGMTRVDSAKDYSYSRPGLATPLLPASMTYGVVQPGLKNADTVWAPSWAGSGDYAKRSDDATPIMARVLVLAARYSVGDVSEGSVKEFAKNNKANKCLVNAKLNLDQCVAATRTPYEEMFCLGTHGLKDVSNCMGYVAGVSG